MDKLSSTALKNKPLFKEWLVRIKKANLLKLGQYQICLEHFETNIEFSIVCSYLRKIIRQFRSVPCIIAMDLVYFW